jgi:YhcH/YjgK/YiaL family protein
MSKKVVTLGEIMLRLSTLDFKRFVQADSFDVTYGGGKANVAAALCNYGLNGTFVTKVPNNPIGQSASNQLRRYGVDTQFIARGGDRLGIYFLETGASMRVSQVVYDRSGASIADVDASEFDLDIGEGLKAIFSNAPGKTKVNSLAKFERHNKNMDIQLCIDGVATIGWKPREKCITPNGDYNEEKDVQLYHDHADTFFELTNGQFAIFFPEDVHAPTIGTSDIKKLVINVKIWANEQHTADNGCHCATGNASLVL